MFALVDAGFLLWVPVGAYEGLGEDGDGCGGLGGWRHVWGIEAVGAGSGGGLVEGRVDGQLEGGMLGLQRPLDVF